MNFMKLLNRVGQGAKDNLPSVMIWGSIGGMIAAIFFTADAKPKADLAIKEKEYELKRKLTKKEKFKVAGKYYIPTVISAVASGGLALGADHLHRKNQAKLLSACALTEMALKEYRDHTKEALGERKERAICSSIAKDSANENVSKPVVPMMAPSGQGLFYDLLTKKEFYSDMQSVRKAVNDINQHLLAGGEYCSVNDYCDALGIKRVYLKTDGIDGDDIGWNIFHGQIDVVIDSIILDDGRACATIYHNNQPHTNYWKVY